MEVIKLESRLENDIHNPQATLMGQSTLSAQDLQRAVAKLGLVQEEFAEKFGVRHASVSRWLNGKVPVPGYVERWLADVHPGIYQEIKGGRVDGEEGR